MYLDCPKCDEGELTFQVWPPEYDVGVGPQPECIDQTCACELSGEEWAALEGKAVEYFNEGPSEP